MAAPAASGAPAPDGVAGEGGGDGGGGEGDGKGPMASRRRRRRPLVLSDDDDSVPIADIAQLRKKLSAERKNAKPGVTGFSILSGQHTRRCFGADHPSDKCLRVSADSGSDDSKCLLCGKCNTVLCFGCAGFSTVHAMEVFIHTYL